MATPHPQAATTTASAAAAVAFAVLLLSTAVESFVLRSPPTTPAAAAKLAPGGAVPPLRTVAPPRPLSRLRATVETPPTEGVSAEDDGDGDGEGEKGEGPWWKSVRFSGASLAESVRSDFPILSTKIGTEGTAESDKKDLVYLDSAATSQKPLYVTDALTRYYHTSNSNVHRGAHCLSREATSQYEGARDAIARFVNAYSRNEVVFTSGASEAINLVASSYGRAHLKKGDVVIISELEHHSNIVPWQMITKETGATLKYVPVNHETGKLDMDVFESLLGPEVKIVSVQHVSNTLGCVHPVEDIVSLTRSNCPDARILLDCCQSVPHMPVDVRELGADWIAASGHKMCGPTGIGFLWGKEDLLNSMDPYMGGGEMIDEVTMESSTYAPSPARFEAGTPAIAQSVGIGAAIEYLEKVGMKEIEDYEHELGAYLYRRLDEVEGVTILGPRPDPKMGGKDRVALCSFVADGVHPSDLSTFLDMEGVAIRAGHHCCQPLHRALEISHSARASLYFYNTKGEIDYFIEKLEETLRFFRSIEGGGDAGAEGGDDDDDFVPFI